MQRASSVQPEHLVELSPAVAEDSVIQRVEPDYPEQAREQQVQGAVVLEAHIRADGTVQELKVVSGPSLLVDAGDRGGKAVEVPAAPVRTVSRQRCKPRSLSTFDCLVERSNPIQECEPVMWQSCAVESLYSCWARPQAARFPVEKGGLHGAGRWHFPARRARPQPGWRLPACRKCGTDNS